MSFLGDLLTWYHGHINNIKISITNTPRLPKKPPLNPMTSIVKKKQEKLIDLQKMTMRTILL